MQDALALLQQIYGETWQESPLSRLAHVLGVLPRRQRVADLVLNVSVAGWLIMHIDDGTDRCPVEQPGCIVDRQVHAPAAHGCAKVIMPVGAV
jgi:hypothetical protein